MGFIIFVQIPEDSVVTHVSSGARGSAQASGVGVSTRVRHRNTIEYSDVVVPTDSADYQHQATGRDRDSTHRR